MNTETDDLAKLRDLVGRGGIAMLTTVGSDGDLEARPMSIEDFDEDGRLWFFTEAGSPKTEQLAADPRALVTLSGKNHISIQGSAQVLRDPARQEALWNRAAEAWLQCGPTDPKVALLVVDAEGAQIWETPGAASALLSVVSAALKRERPDLGNNERLDL